MRAFTLHAAAALASKGLPAASSTRATAGRDSPANRRMAVTTTVDHATAAAQAFAESLRPLVSALTAEGMNMTAITAELNKRRVKTAGRAGVHGRWHGQQVKRLVERLAQVKVAS